MPVVVALRPCFFIRAYMSAFRQPRRGAKHLSCPSSVAMQSGIIVCMPVGKSNPVPPEPGSLYDAVSRLLLTNPRSVAESQIQKSIFEFYVSHSAW